MQVQTVFRPPFSVEFYKTKPHELDIPSARRLNESAWALAANYCAIEAGLLGAETEVGKHFGRMAAGTAG